MKETSRAICYILLAFIVAIIGVYFLALKSGLNDNAISFIILAPLACLSIWLIVTVYKYRVSPPRPPELIDGEEIIEGEIVD